MKKYLLPLWTFLLTQVFILMLYLFFPTIAVKLAALWSATSTAPFWGWEWAVTSVRILIVVVAELASLYAVYREFMYIQEMG